MVIGFGQYGAVDVMGKFKSAASVLKQVATQVEPQAGNVNFSAAIRGKTPFDPSWPKFILTGSWKGVFIDVPLSSVQACREGKPGNCGQFIEPGTSTGFQSGPQGLSLVVKATVPNGAVLSAVSPSGQTIWSQILPANTLWERPEAVQSDSDPIYAPPPPPAYTPPPPATGMSPTVMLLGAAIIGGLFYKYGDKLKKSA